VISAMAGFIALVAGIGLLELISANMPATEFFRNPEVDFSIGVSATLILVLAGVIAGFFPALRAARIKPVVALKDE